MMKHAMLALATALLALSGAGRSVAQEWFPQGAEWYFTGTGATPIRYVVAGDTLLNDTLAKKVEIHTLGGYTGNTLCVHEAQGRAWLWQEDAFELRVDMNLSAGDTFPGALGWFPGYEAMVVDSIGHWEAGGPSVRLKALYLSAVPATLSSCHFIHIERVGTTIAFMRKEDCTTAADLVRFRCYSDQDVSFRLVDYPCDSATVVHVEALAKAAPPPSAFPNPTQGRFALELPAGQTHAALAIFDALGAKVLETSYREGQELDLTGLPAGVYFVSLEIANRETRTVTIIKSD